jgi:hypothetical protein
MSRPTGEALAGAAVAAVTLAIGLPALGWPASSADEMLLLVEPARMLQGQLPYEDFFSVYGPAHWWFLEATFRLFGLSVTVARVAGLGVHVALALGVFVLAGKRGTTVATTCGLLTALVLFRVGDGPYAWVSACTLVVWSLALLSRWEGHLAAAAAGLLASLAIGFRPDAALLAVAPALPLLWGAGRWRAWLAGAAVGALPLVVSIVLTPSGLVDQVLLGRAGQGATQNRLPLPTDADQLGLLVLLVAALLLLLLASLRSRDRWVTALALLAALALPQALQRAERVHFLYAGLVSVVFLPAALATLGGSRRLPAAVAGAALVLIGASQSSVRPLVETLAGDGLGSVDVTHAGRRVPETPRRAAALRRLLPVLDGLATPGSRLLVFDANLRRPALTDLTVYYLMPQVTQEAFSVDINAGISNGPKGRLLEDLGRTDLLVLVQVTPAQQHRTYPYEKDGPTDVERLRERVFCPVAEIDYYEVYRRCAT